MSNEQLHDPEGHHDLRRIAGEANIHESISEYSRPQLAAMAMGVHYGPDTHDPEAIAFLDELFADVVLREETDPVTYIYPEPRWKDDIREERPSLRNFYDGYGPRTEKAVVNDVTTDLVSSKESQLGRIKTWWESAKPDIMQEFAQSASALREMSDFIKHDALMLPEDDTVKGLIVSIPPFLAETIAKGSKATAKAYKNIGTGIADSAAEAIANHPEFVQNLRRVGAPTVAAAVLLTVVAYKNDIEQKNTGVDKTEQATRDLPLVRTANYTEITVPELAVGQDLQQSVKDASDASGIPAEDIKIDGATMSLPKDVKPGEVTKAVIAALVPEATPSQDAATTTVPTPVPTPEPATNPESTTDIELMNDNEYIDWLANQVEVSAEDYAQFDVDTSREDAFKDELSGAKISPTRFVGHWTAGLYKNGVDQFISAIKNREGNCCSVMYFMDKNAKVYRLTDSDEKTAHAKGANSNSQGVEIEARGLKDYTPEQMKAFVMLSLRFMTANDIPIERINLVGHSELGTGKPDMPAALVDRLFPKLQKLAQEVAEGGGSITIDQPPAPNTDSNSEHDSNTNLDSAINNLLEYIAKGEGGWDSVNRHKAGDTLLQSKEGRAAYISIFGDRMLTDLTIQEVMDMQNADKIMAVGKFQFIPSTLASAVRVTHIDTSIKFDEEAQLRLAREYLLMGNKQPKLTSYLKGENNDLERAIEGLCAEWASLVCNDGEGRYNGLAGNNASGGQTKLNEQKALLEAVRSAYLASQNTGSIATEPDPSPILPPDTSPIPEVATTTTTEIPIIPEKSNDKHQGVALSREGAMKAYSVWFPNDEDGLRAWVDNLPVNEDGTVQVSIYNIPDVKKGDK